MAKKVEPKKSKKAAPAPVTTPRAPRKPKVVEPPKKAKKSGKGGAKKDRSRRNKELLIALGTAMAYGAAESRGMLSELPKIEALGVAGTYGAAAVAAGIYMKNPLVEDIGTVLAILGARNFGYVQFAEKPTATKGDFRDVGEIPPAAALPANTQFAAQLPPGTPVLGVDPRLLAELTDVLEGDDDDDLSGDDDDDDDVSGDEFSDVSGDDDADDVSGDDSEPE